MKKKLDYKAYPAPDATRSGAKVGWYYYRNPDEARTASAVALHNANIQAGLGFDFGFQSPGSVTLMQDGERAGMWEVCIP